MHLIYIDDSNDSVDYFLSALVLPVENWHAALDQIKQFRRDLNRHYGIYVRKEQHARNWVTGRGKIGSRDVPKGLRCRLFRESLEMTATLPGIRSFNVSYKKKYDDWAWERLLNRINRMMMGLDGYAIVFCDQGKESRYTALRRQMAVFNPIPSRFGGWGGIAGSTKNITLDRIVEDPIFLRSEHSFFIQLADFCAYALLRQEKPLPARNAYGLDTAFMMLDAILMTQASPDPQGIIRVP